MLVRKKILVAMIFLLLAFTFAAPQANAKGNEYKQIVKHLKTKYQAKKVKIPFLRLARFAVSVVRPAGIKSFSITIFEDLKFSCETLDEEMQAAVIRATINPEKLAEFINNPKIFGISLDDNEKLARNTTTETKETEKTEESKEEN